jgi:hypothetical protein
MRTIPSSIKKKLTNLYLHNQKEIASQKQTASSRSNLLNKTNVNSSPQIQEFAYPWDEGHLFAVFGGFGFSWVIG